ncbi:MAG TPA: glycoside hydrolase family 15 protein [Thermoplasmata archaeon]|nr:glycoside hydrolase family 15 protein [Thermoplasmata archaeon]
MPSVRRRRSSRPGRAPADASPAGPSLVPPDTAYHPLSEYGIIGNLRTVALVGTDGSIDWMCFPHFDSPTCFAALLDHARGGRFRIAPVQPTTRKQLYLPDTNVLINRFLGRQGVAEVTDFMPLAQDRERVPSDCLIRRVTAIRGTVDLALDCRPAFDYAREAPRAVRCEGGAIFEGRTARLGLASPVPLEVDGPGARATFTLAEDDVAWFLLKGIGPGRHDRLASYGPSALGEVLQETVRFWRRWIARSKYRGRWREMVNRSALVLKLLTFEPTGAIVAAPTFGLPEVIGGERNWDYRYTWIRDAAFTLYAFLRLGFTEEAEGFMHWLLGRTTDLEPDGSLHPVYRIDGSHELPEIPLPHLEGYRGSRPVRIGNAAVDQLQLDIYGALLDAVYLYNKHGSPISYELWTRLRRILDWLTENWRRPDKGIWEVRSVAADFVYSNMMCWVAFDRAIRVAENRGFPADILRWRTTRDEIYEQIMRDGWDPRRGAFVQSYGASALDASTLLMPLVFFVSAKDPRMVATLDAIRGELVSDSLVRRYSTDETADGLTGREGTFSLCSFWLVEALTRAGRLDEAQLIFEKVLGHASHLGLFSEEIGSTGEALGNFPQAFTHLALISAAVNLDRALGEGA